MRSPLTQGRGSKPDLEPVTVTRPMSPLTQGRGSKPSASGPRFRNRRGRPSRRGVDRNTPLPTISALSRGRPSRRGVDRNKAEYQALVNEVPVAPHAGAWIETAFLSYCPSDEQVAPHAGAWIETRRIGRGRTGRGSRPSRRGVDRNMSSAPTNLPALRRPSRRGVDRNSGAMFGIGSTLGSPLTQGRGSKPDGGPGYPC